MRANILIERNELYDEDHDHVNNPGEASQESPTQDRELVSRIQDGK